jgi:hypothetical protein
MKLSLPAYLVALGVSFLYAVIHYYVPTLPLTQEQVMWVVIVILTALHIDVVNALRVRGLLG